jgi:hypothetical protein
MKKGIKILGVLFLVFAVFFTMSIRDAEAATCYKLYYSWNWSDWYLGYIVMYNGYTSDGYSFEYFDDDGYYNGGWWYKYGTTYAFDWDEGCYAFYSGTLAKGFMQCTDGNYIGDDPGIYQLKKTNCKFVPFGNSKNAKTKGSDKKGPSPNNPQ